MRAINVIPISRGVFKENLSYFTAKEVKPGAVVSVPVRNRQIDALVIESQPVNDLKAAIKSAEFSLKKISRIKSECLFRQPFLKAAERAAVYFAAPFGQVLKSAIPKIILDQAAELPPLLVSEVEPAPPAATEKFVLQDTEEERFSFYRTLIREAFSQNASVFLLVPTRADLERARALLERGISEYTIILHSDLPKKELLKNWRRAATAAHPLLIVGTPLFLSLPRPDIKTIIVEKENTTAYKTFERPFLDFRKFAEFFAAAAGIKLICGDDFLRTETIYRAEQGEFSRAALKQRLLSGAEQFFFNINPAEVLGKELAEILEEAASRHERTFLLVNRRGLAPVIVCSDCGEAVTCHDCGAPVGLHQTRGAGVKEANIFVCHRCGTIKSAEAKCEHCTSWRLQALGFGIEKVREAVAALLPQTPIFQIDSDKIKSRDRGDETAAQFLASPGAILLGTEMAVYYLKEKVENTAAAAVDSLLTLPDFRSGEKLFNLLLRVRSLAAKRFIIQSRYRDLPLFNYVLQGRLTDFYRQEIEERHNFEYPPFKLFIKVSLAGPREKVKNRMKELKNGLNVFAPIVFPSLYQSKNKYHLNLLLKISLPEWPNRKILETLKNLPPDFIVTVDPNTIL